jgi:hypothetical protein
MSYPRVVFVLLLLLSGAFLNALSYLKGKEWMIFFLDLGSCHNFSHLNYGNLSSLLFIQLNASLD